MSKHFYQIKIIYSWFQLIEYVLFVGFPSGEGYSYILWLVVNCQYDMDLV